MAYTSGASQDGRLGVESWILRELVAEARVQPTAVSPRLLQVRVDGPVCFAHVVAHAPTNASGEADKDEFWASLRSLLRAPLGLVLRSLRSMPIV